MVFIDIVFKNIFFSSLPLILLLSNPLRVETQNVSQILNENNFTENSFANLTINSSDVFKQKSLTNGRMHSFFGEEEAELEYSPQNIFWETRNQTKLNSSENFSQKLTKDVYFHPIFNYQINSNENNSIVGKNRSNNISNVSLVTSGRKSGNKLRYRFKKKFSNQTNYNLPEITNRFSDYNNSKIISFDKKVKQILNSLEDNSTEVEENLSTIQSDFFLNISVPIDIPPNSPLNESFLEQKLFRHQKNQTKRFCVSSVDCEIKLNERCINQIRYSMCGCREPFFREEISQKCQIKKLIRLLFKVSSNDSLNWNSIDLIQTKYLIERNIWIVIMNSTNLLTTVDDIKVIEIIDSKIVVDFYVKIANPTNNFHHKYIEYHFWYRLMSIIKGINFQTIENHFNSFDLRAVEIINDIDYCSVKELNYCSDSAICVEDIKSETKFKCQCKPGLTDLSPNTDFKGEVCALKCNTEMCGTGGLCQIRNETEIECICINWNFGDRCQYSFNTIVCVSALFLIFSIVFSFCLSALYCGYKIHEEFNKLRNLIKNNSNADHSLALI